LNRLCHAKTQTCRLRILFELRLPRIWSDKVGKRLLELPAIDLRLTFRLFLLSDEHLTLR